MVLVDSVFQVFEVVEQLILGSNCPILLSIGQVLMVVAVGLWYPLSHRLFFSQFGIGLQFGIGHHFVSGLLLLLLEFGLSNVPIRMNQH